MNELLAVLGLSLVTGLSTGLGGLIAILHKTGRRRFGFLMGFTAGVMLTLAFMELVNEAWRHAGYLTATLGFGLGSLFMFLLDCLIPHIRFEEREGPKIDWKLFKSGMLMAIGVSIHNIPEGIAVGAGYMHTPRFGVIIAVAIALHNIPEGIMTALPLCRSGVCRWRAFRMALFSGLVEPLGAMLAVLFLRPYQSLIPGALAFAGGVMTFIVLDELIPTAREHGHEHFTALGIIVGASCTLLLIGVLGRVG
jgi:ZIP family zinc transporter